MHANDDTVQYGIILVRGNISSKICRCYNDDLSDQNLAKASAVCV